MKTAIALVGALLLSGCGADLSCSATQTKDLAQQIVRRELKNSVIYDSNFDTDKTTITLNDIITTEKTSKKTSCKATLAIGWISKRQGVDASLAKRDFPVTYTVEQTDDDRLYVTLYGFQ